MMAGKKIKADKTRNITEALNEMFSHFESTAEWDAISVICSFNFCATFGISVSLVIWKRVYGGYCYCHSKAIDKGTNYILPDFDE